MVLKGSTLSKKTIENIRRYRTGKKHSEETKQKIREARLGNKMSKQTKDKISKSNKGKIGSMNGRTHSKESIERMRIAQSGKVLSDEHKSNLSIATRGRHNHNWKGGITSLNNQIRNCFKNKAWRIEVFKKNNYTCQLCNAKKYVLNAHHIKSFSLIMEENNIKHITEAIHCDELWDINNGITYCESCHLEYHRNYSNDKLDRENIETEKK